jgi:hypothetical protein
LLARKLVVLKTLVPQVFAVLNATDNTRWDQERGGVCPPRLVRGEEEGVGEEGVAKEEGWERAGS